MIQTKVFSQRDPKWRYDKLGFSNLTLGGYGCLITSLASMLYYFGYRDETPKTVNAKLKKNKGFVGALLVWSAVERVWPRVKFTKLALQYNNLQVSWYVYGKKIPVIVKVHAPQIGAINHWQLWVGDRTALDPWYGKGIPTSTFKPLRYSLFDHK
jgi:hypothetical protein